MDQFPICMYLVILPPRKEHKKQKHLNIIIQGLVFIANRDKINLS